MATKCLKYTLTRRESRNWFSLPQDSDHWRCQYRQMAMTDRLAKAAAENGFAGLRVFHANGTLLMTVRYKKVKQSNKVSIECTPTQDAAVMEKEAGDVSFSGRMAKRAALRKRGISLN